MPFPNPVRRPFDGGVQMQLRYGNAAGGINSASGTPDAGAGLTNQRNIIVTRGIPTNPLNQGYMPVVNNSNYPSVVAKGMRTPSISLTACMKPYNGTSGWCDAKFMNSLMSLGTDQNSDAFAVRFTDDSSTARTWDWSRCEMVQISCDASGGPVMVTMSFKSRFGNAESESIYGATFLAGNNPPASPATWAAAAVDPGQLTYNADWDFAGTLSDVQSFSLTLLRGQRWRSRAGVCVAGPAANRILYANDVDSGQFSGVLTVVQDAGAATIIAGAGSPILKMNSSYSSANGGFQIAMSVNDDNYVYPVESAFGTLTTTYSLINLAGGGNPAVIS